MKHYRGSAFGWRWALVLYRSGHDPAGLLVWGPARWARWFGISRRDGAWSISRGRESDDEPMAGGEAWLS